MLHFLQNLVVVCAVWVLYKNHKFYIIKTETHPHIMCTTLVLDIEILIFTGYYIYIYEIIYICICDSILIISNYSYIYISIYLT